jgi:hypothetical protein
LVTICADGAKAFALCDRQRLYPAGKGEMIFLLTNPGNHNNLRSGTATSNFPHKPVLKK